MVDVTGMMGCRPTVFTLLTNKDGSRRFINLIAVLLQRSTNLYMDVFVAMYSIRKLSRLRGRFITYKSQIKSR